MRDPCWGAHDINPNRCSTAHRRRLMRPNQSFVLTTAALFLFCGSAFSQAGTCSGMTVGQLTSLNGFEPFPSNNLWNTDISAAPVDPNSANYINFIGSTVTLHPDFAAGLFPNQSLGI